MNRLASADSVVVASHYIPSLHQLSADSPLRGVCHFCCLTHILHQSTERLEVARQLLLLRETLREQVGHCPQGRTGDCYTNEVPSGDASGTPRANAVACGGKPSRSAVSPPARTTENQGFGSLRRRALFG